MKLILHPPRKHEPGKPWERLALRLHRLIGLLDGKSDSKNPEQRQLDRLVASHCQVTISNIPRPNTLILGRRKCFEALRRGLGRGFETTYWTTTAKEVEQIVQGFDNVFDDCRKSCPDNQAAITELEKALSDYKQSVGKGWKKSKLPPLS